ncbi:unnamed protein product [Linum tenue]|uniref:Transmembrane protein n=1 Tax=Linum tenue TaxID=586396 RepID=A0AAV0Q4U0_9ROSI|nr:unnamed protein product [Linum tenue]
MANNNYHYSSQKQRLRSILIIVAMLFSPYILQSSEASRGLLANTDDIWFGAPPPPIGTVPTIYCPQCLCCEPPPPNLCCRCC